MVVTLTKPRIPCSFPIRLESAIPLLQRELSQVEGPLAIAFPDEGAFKRFHTMFHEDSVIVCTKIREGKKRYVKIKDGILVL